MVFAGAVVIAVLAIAGDRSSGRSTRAGTVAATTWVESSSHARRADRLALLSSAQQAALSGVAGADSPAFHARPSSSGYSLDAAGLTANLAKTAITFDTGTSSVGLALAGVGRGAALRVPPATRLLADANRVTLERGALSEWYLAGPLGIEQGFTVRRHVAGSGPLKVKLRRRRLRLQRGYLG